MKQLLHSILFFSAVITVNAQAWEQVGGVINGDVLTLQIYDDKLMVGGSYTSVGGNTSYLLSEWNGSTYSDYNTVLIGGSDISDMIVYEGKLLCAGNFYVNAFYGPGFVMEWTGSTFEGDEYYINSNIYHIDVNGSTFYISGYFTEFLGTTFNHVAFWNGSDYEAISEGFDYGPGGFIIFNDDLVVGGGPDDFGISKFDGLYWSQLGDNAPAGGQLAIYKDELYAINGLTEPARYITKWNGTEWVDVGGSLTGGGNGARAMLVVGEYLYVGGDFTGAGGVTCKNVARWDGENWSAVGDGTFGNFVSDLEYYQGSLYATSYDVNGDNHLLKYNGVISPVDDIITDITIDIFPNPVAANLNVTINNLNADCVISIRNIYGQIIYSSSASNGNNIIDGEKFAAGYYQLCVRSGFNEIYESFVKR